MESDALAAEGIRMLRWAQIGLTCDAKVDIIAGRKVVFINAGGRGLLSTPPAEPLKGHGGGLG